MSRYSKIDRRIHHDAKFRALSRPQPNGQSLWFYLLANPHLVNVPGLFCAGEAMLAEALEWPVKGFREAFAELFAKGMAKADWTARLVWVPRAIKYNRPENPNVVKGWVPAWDELPECDLKNEAWNCLYAYLKGLPKGYAEAFAEGCRKGMPNQEQEQEQEQEHTHRVARAREGDPDAADPEAAQARANGVLADAGTPPRSLLVDWWDEFHRAADGCVAPLRADASMVLAGQGVLALASARPKSGRTVGAFVADAAPFGRRWRDEPMTIQYLVRRTNGGAEYDCDRFHRLLAEAKLWHEKRKASAPPVTP